MGSLGGLHLVVGHNSIGSTEINRSIGDLGDTGAGADGLIIDLDSELLSIDIKPLGIQWRREGPARTT